jgi:uncharacterized cupin superfamily protein
MKSVHVPDLAWNERRSATGRFWSCCRDISVALGCMRNVGTWGGGHPFDVQIRRIPAGAAVCPFHCHLAQWELFMVLAGRARVRVAEEMHHAETGEVFVHPPGEIHQLSNPGPADLEVLIVADNPPLDGFWYPDSNKWGFRPPLKVFRMTEVDYLAGEDDSPAAPGVAVFTPPPAPMPPVATPFSSRKLHPDSLPWETWKSPKGKFRGASKELSIALGAKRDAPPGLGGHPFDLELNRLGPSECGVPLHSHAAQWEFFYVLSGAASIRTPDGVHAFGPGDAILQEPGSAHQIRNGSSTDDLLFLLIADNPPVDIFHYPDTGKWGLRPLRKFFRMAEEPYWGGEE